MNQIDENVYGTARKLIVGICVVVGVLAILSMSGCVIGTRKVYNHNLLMANWAGYDRGLKLAIDYANRYDDSYYIKWFLRNEQSTQNQREITQEIIDIRDGY